MTGNWKAINPLHAHSNEFPSLGRTVGRFPPFFVIAELVDHVFLIARSPKVV